jgi:hypothetical protein
MTTEYPLQEGDDPVKLAQDLIEQATDPDHVHWYPRPDTAGGGVFVLADPTIAERVRAKRQADAEAEAQAKLAKAAEAETDDEGDEPDETGDEPPAEDGARPLTAAQKRAAKKQAAAGKAAAQTPEEPAVGDPADAPAEGGAE